MSVPPIAPSWRRILGRRVLGATALLVVAVAIFVGLGLWQYDGWQAQRAAEQRDLTARAPVPIGAVIGADDPFPGDEVGRPVRWSGEWVEDSGFVVGPRELRGREGWWAAAVATVDSGDGTETSVPVVTGWIPDADVPQPAGPVAVTGFLQPGEGSLARDEDPTDRVFPELRLASLTELVPIDLTSAYVVASTLTPAQDATPVPPDQVPEVGVSTALRNLLYALQWWILAVGALVVWGRFVRDEVGDADGRRGRFAA